MRTEWELIQKAKQGDAEAFTELARKYRGTLSAVGYSILGSIDEAQDVAQEALIRVHSQLRTFNEQEGIARWAYVVARNLAVSRKRLRRRELGLDSLALTTKELQVDVDNGAVWAGLSRLSEESRQSLILYYIGEYSGKEIAQMQGVSPSTVRSRLTKARRELRGELIQMVRRDLSELMSRSEYVDCVKKLAAFPVIEPSLSIVEDDGPLPDPDFREGAWFFVPLVQNGSALAAWYDYPEKDLTDTTFMRVLGKATIAGIDCWEVCTIDSENRSQSEYLLWYWAVDDQCVKLVGIYNSQAERLATIHDVDWAEDTRGYPRRPANLPIAPRISDNEFETNADDPLALIGSYTVTINGISHRCIRVIDAQPSSGILVEAYINGDGRTVLFRRYNGAPKWSQASLSKQNSRGAVEYLESAGNNRITFNGHRYYHWYDCITCSGFSTVAETVDPIKDSS